MQTSVIEILRRPDAPNAIYHRACYVPQRDEIVLGVIALKDSVKCAVCKKRIKKGLIDIMDNPFEEQQIVQLSLWESEGAA